MTPYSATDLVRAIRQTYGIPDVESAPAESPSRTWRWIAVIFRRA
ncbi:MAG: hypothetical protein WKF63_04365 [Thermomicrobiales bacterium]